ncbi:contactin-associated protein-like 4 isoform X2 [Trichomycterus rosablanca]|uniref:contactin-associated protein-like 4 isoform X2 n=1 Tax=Trichomycterus rosablanca TaxID=2290929 RepID=UPI002F35C9FC
MDLFLTSAPSAFLHLSVILSCSRVALSKDGCDNQLVSNLPQSAFRSSSQLSNSHGPGYAKLNRRDGAGGWSPLDSSKYQWLEINLGERTEVTAVATQGRYGSSDWVTRYHLMFSDTGHNWKQFQQEGSIGAFLGNTNADSVVAYKLQHPVFTQFLRLIPLDWNPNGRVGLRLEAYGCQYKSNIARFDGSSYLLLNPTTNPQPKDLLTMNFKTVHNSGVLMHMEGKHGHTVTLELIKGKLFLHLRKGYFHTGAALGSLLDDQHWHHVSIEQHQGHFNFTVDKTTQQLQLPEHQGHFEMNEISFGGVSAVRTSENSRRKFHGCLENVLYNNVNVIELAKEKRLTIKGNITFSCLEDVDVPVTFSSSESFLQLPWTSARDSMSLRLQFRTWNKAGLIITFDLQHQEGTLWVYLSEGRMRMQIYKAGRVMADSASGSALNDGQWHSVNLSFRRGRLILSVDKSDSSAVTTSFSVIPASHLFLGGCPSANYGCRNSFDVFHGCMRLIHMDESLVDLIKVQQMLMGNYSGLQVDVCGIIDRCSANHCEHGGKCTQSWSTFHCNCTGTGYRGATCHSSIHEASCEAYKHKGNTSGFYHIDVDGGGPMKPQLVYCNMSDKVWTVIPHNNTELTKLRVSTGSSKHMAFFNYSADVEQLSAIITRSERCQQEVSYHCKKSRLLNTPDGAPFTWWVGRSGDANSYWAGAVPGLQRCACAVHENCLNPERFCNCDSDLDDWVNDSGVLSHKEHLPIRLLAVGDMNRPGLEAAYRVGPLQCYGDNEFWHAARFDKETSYLHFPTFNAELSADISFFFKTSSHSGLFLENLGIKDFIRIELSSPTEVTFSFNVGNGPLEVRVVTSVPLNDERWHYVVAERNVKEATLSVDHYPIVVQKAPAEGHIYLRLNSQLYVGGTASRQKGFLGCIRSLKLNGKTLDLEERAKITPDVHPGCPGHCSSYGQLCQNQGHCLEKLKGFTCDCDALPYSGTFCHKEISAFFRPDTSVKYTLKEPYELNRNKSALSSIYSGLTSKGENISLSFRTTQTPAMLLYISTYYREYLTVFLNRNGHLEVRYKLQNNRDVDVFKSNVKNLANGQLHRVSIRRVSASLSLQIDQNTVEDFNLSSDIDLGAIKAIIIGKVNEPEDLDEETTRLCALGFTGCLSVVQFNSISPLKAALLYPHTSPVIVTGLLTESNCASASSSSPYSTDTTHSLSDHVSSVDEPVVNAISRDSALIGGVIAVVIFVILACLAVMARFFYRRKETFQTPESKEAKVAESPEAALNNDPNSQSLITDSQKEYFI